jgi:hypothetical protein
MAPVGLLLFFVASPAFAGTVTGTVRNGTTGKPAAGVEMILIQLQGTMQPVANTKTDADGHYRFVHPGLGAGPMLIRAVYRGVNYHEPATPDKTTVDVEVFEPTNKPSAFAVTVHAIIFQPTGSDLTITEEYNISNKTNPPLAYYRADGSFVFSLPEGAQLSNISAVGASGMPVVQSSIDKGQNQQAIAFPFRPGDNQASLHFASPYPVEHLGLFAPPSVQISGGGFVASGQAQGFSAYTRDSVAANTSVSVSISGTAPPRAPVQGGAAVGNAPADDSQNPSVNSRIDTGNEAPVASVTTLPARLDSLKWILVGGFVALFLLGLIYVARQPQTAVSAEGVSGSIPGVAPYPARPAGFAQPAPGSSSAASASAELDREVRGSLDELKDVLFRLELRREAGTITETDYARERDRVQKALRDLVKG